MAALKLKKSSRRFFVDMLLTLARRALLFLLEWKIFQKRALPKKFVSKLFRMKSDHPAGDGKKW